MTAKAIPIELDHSFEIVVPTECRCGKLLPEEIRDQVLEEVKSSMGTWFGGGFIEEVDIRDGDGFFDLERHSCYVQNPKRIQGQIWCASYNRARQTETIHSEFQGKSAIIEP